ncbi:MAG: PadR family transcriptional regulator [Dehalococcoidia bacterium]
MDIKFAILGFVSWKPCSGYDLKKIFADSVFIPWSGSNNQIYRTLMDLHREELVTNEVQYQENYPPRKVYTITEKGLSELRNWVLSSPEAPQLINSFLIQLAWADQLEQEELDELLDKYEYEVNMQLIMGQERIRRENVNPARTPREEYLWNMICQNWVTSYENELSWIRKLRQELEGR